MEPSPYLPTTRRFANPLYLRISDIPELAGLDPDAAALVDRLGQSAQALNAQDRIDRDAAWSLKREALEIIHDAGLTGERAQALAAYAEREADGLRDFATWCALVDRFGSDAQQWPEGLDGPRAPAVAAFRRKNASLVDFHVWLQWQVEQQLAAVQEQARTAGMPLGIVHDLAVGVHPTGADAWGLADALASGVSVGAPPDSSISAVRTGVSLPGAPTG